MVKIDLDKLAAPLEAMRPDVDAAYKRLDSKWEEICERLKKLPIPCEISTVIYFDSCRPDDYTSLEWRKYNGKRRICIVSYHREINNFGEDEHSHTVTPYEEWSAEQRVGMLNHVPRLFERAVEQVQKFIAKTQE